MLCHLLSSYPRFSEGLSFSADAVDADRT